MTFTECLLVRTRRHSCSGRTPKGYLQGDGARSLRVAHFRALASFLAMIREQSIGASRARLSMCGWSTSVPYPCAPKCLESTKFRLPAKRCALLSPGPPDDL